MSKPLATIDTHPFHPPARAVLPAADRHGHRNRPRPLPPFRHSGIRRLPSDTRHPPDLYNLPLCPAPLMSPKYPRPRNAIVRRPPHHSLQPAPGRTPDRTTPPAPSPPPPSMASAASTLRAPRPASACHTQKRSLVESRQQLTPHALRHTPGTTVAQRPIPV